MGCIENARLDVATLAGKVELTKGSAIVAYAEALKASTKEALDAALAKVEAANPVDLDQEWGEIEELIKLHPAC